MKRAITFCLLLVFVLVTLLAGCAAPTSSPEAKEKVLRIATGKDDYTNSWGGKAVLCSEGLVIFDSNMKIKPLLAESWKVEDGKIYTFQLRKGIKFHDGTPFNAQAVKNAFKTYLKKSAIRDGIEAIETPDDYTVKFILKKANPLFLSNLAVFEEILSPAAVKKALEEGVSEELIPQRVFVGTGPFKFSKWTKGQEVVFVKNEDYWQGEVKLDRIDFKIIPDPHTRVISLEAGEVDLIGNDPFSLILPQEVLRLQNNPEIRLYHRAAATTYGLDWFSFNTGRDPFNDLQLRKAVKYAVNVHEIVKAIFGNEEPVAKGPFPESSKFARPDLRSPEYNPDLAKRLLAQAGWSDTDNDGIVERNGKPFKITLAIGTREPAWNIIAEMIQAQLKKVGIALEIETYEDQALREKWKKGEFDLIAQTSIGSPHDDPQSHFETYYSTHGNLGFPPVIRDEELDKYIGELKMAAGEERIQKYHAIQKRIEELVPGVYLYHEPMFAAAAKKLKNFEISPPLPWHRYQVLWKVDIEE